MYVYTYIYIYIYIRRRTNWLQTPYPGGADGLWKGYRLNLGSTTVGFHNLKSSNLQLESLKSEQINCGCFFDTMSDFNVPGSRPKQNIEISEIDRTCLTLLV